MSEPRDGDMLFTTNVWSRIPIFHAHGTYNYGQSFCGRARADAGQFLPRRHAERIGRACKACLNYGMVWRPQTTHTTWSYNS